MNVTDIFHPLLLAEHNDIIRSMYLLCPINIGNKIQKAGITNKHGITLKISQ